MNARIHTPVAAAAAMPAIGTSVASSQINCLNGYGHKSERESIRSDLI